MEAQSEKYAQFTQATKKKFEDFEKLRLKSAAEIKELKETIEGLDDTQIMLQNDRLTS